MLHFQTERLAIWTTSSLKVIVTVAVLSVSDRLASSIATTVMRSPGWRALAGVVAYFALQMPASNTWAVPERPANIRIVAANGLPNLLGRLVDYLEADFRRWPEFDKSPRTAAHSALGVIELMPVSDAKEFSFKYVNGHPGNTKLGLSTVVAFGVLADMDTGMPILISELTLTTALRTAATSVMAAKLLARKDAKTMALIGNGAQSEFQALAFHHLMGIEEVRVFDTDPAATDKLVRNLATVVCVAVSLFCSVLFSAWHWETALVAAGLLGMSAGFVCQKCFGGRA